MKRSFEADKKDKRVRFRWNVRSVRIAIKTGFAAIHGMNREHRLTFRLCETSEN
jgi:hypothetical protein